MVYSGLHVPRQFMGIMISSNFEEFKQHRAALIGIISGQGLHPVAMEHDSARPSGTVIDSSLQKVRDAAAYVGIIGARYGSVPDSADHNPGGLSLTELEFREACDLGRPVLLFIMGADHEVKQRDVELDPERRRKLAAFREEARKSPGSSVCRVYKVFNSLSEFEVAAAQSVAELRRLLDAQAAAGWQLPRAGAESASSDGIPVPPALYAEPRYVGSHAFVGRDAQLETLDDWAAAADPHPVLLFEAIGGAGKSMLAWEWVIGRAAAVRGDWAGMFWYSFYENGAVMSDFCRRALAYASGQPLAAFQDMKQPELGILLARELRARCWLVVLDGLELVLVAYHRHDDAQLADDQAGRCDEIADRDPRSCVRPFDDDLLRELAAAGPSKIVITSRLVPRALLNTAHQPLPGVLHERLPGLRPADAEALLRTCGVHGDSQQIQDFLQRHCDCHPLVTGIVAGLINDYLPARGLFDAWAADPDHGARLNVGHLDLIQKRNHILTAALNALPAASCQLLTALSLLTESVDYALLSALYLQRPARPQAATHLDMPPGKLVSAAPAPVERERARREDLAAPARPHAAWRTRPAAALDAAVRDLERRGLLQYEPHARRWDLHPVVRAVASARLGDSGSSHIGRQIIDHFSQKRGNPYAQATTISDLRDAITIVRTMLQTGRRQEALRVVQRDLVTALLFNMEEYPAVLSLIRPFFSSGWSCAADDLADDSICLLASHASLAFAGLGQYRQSAELDQLALKTRLQLRKWRGVQTNLANLSTNLRDLNQLARSARYSAISLRLAETLGNAAHLFAARLSRFKILALTGQWDQAEEIWHLLDPMGRDWPRNLYRPGDAELLRLDFLLFPLQRMTEADLIAAERVAASGQNRKAIRSLHRLRARWQMSVGDHGLAAENFQEAIRMAHQTGFRDPEAETLLALTLHQLGQLPAARNEAARLSAARDQAHLPLAELWHALADTDQAVIHATAAYRHAWADGEPYVRWQALRQAETLLQALQAQIPELPAYNPERHPPDPWEHDLTTAITELQQTHNKPTTPTLPGA